MAIAAQEKAVELNVEPQHEVSVLEEETETTTAEAPPILTVTTVATGIDVSEIQSLLREKLSSRGLENYYVIAEFIIRNEGCYGTRQVNPISGATGCAQIILSTWNYYKCTGTRFDVNDNLECMSRIIERNGVRDWCADYTMAAKINRAFPNACKPEWIDPRSYSFY